MMNCRISKIEVGLAVMILLGGAPRAAAQDEAPAQDDEPLYEELVRHFKKPYLSIGALFQAVADFQAERSFAGSNGFSIANMRISLSGELDGGFGYFFQTNFVRSPAILDASLHYRVAPALVVEAGLFKAPFSRELLTGAGAIDFVNRAQVVRALAPARQIGAAVGGTLLDGALAWDAGLFNGNGFDGLGNDNDDFLWAGRLAIHPPGFQTPDTGDGLEIALNVGTSRDDDADLGDFVPGFDGERRLVGGDFRWESGRLLIAGELIAADLDPSVGGEFDPHGFHLTAGWHLTAKAQVLGRWDSFSPDGIAPDSDLLIAGLNIWPTRVTELQVNYIYHTQESLENSQLLVNAQVSF
jgi:hypothetical protein